MIELIVIGAAIPVLLMFVLFVLPPAVYGAVEWFADHRRQRLSQYKHPADETIGDDLVARIKRAQNRFRPYPAKKRWFGS